MTFLCDKLTLEGVCHSPEGGGPFPAVVLCHPHPLFGGSMDVSLISALARALAASSIVALRFNFRGVGRSQGKFGGGIKEQDDTIAALNWLALQPQVDITRIGLAGYSFGAVVALHVAVRDQRVKCLSLISPVLNQDGIDKLRNCRQPKLILCGSQDSIIPDFSLIQTAVKPEEFELIPGADHFWWQHETELINKVLTFFNHAL